MKFEFDSSAFDDVLEEIKFFDIECPECHRSFEFSTDDIGKIVLCPHCGRKIKIEAE